jgi:hypothetical protein
LSVCLIAAPFLLVASCGKSGPKLYDVHGKVLYNGQPLAGAQVVFHPLGTSDPTEVKPTANTAADGSFRLSTYPHGEGARLGEYTVLVTQYPPDAREKGGRNRLPKKYESPDTSPLKATVKAESNHLEPLELTK